MAARQKDAPRDHSENRKHADHDEAEASDACVCPSTDRDEGEQ